MAIFATVADAEELYGSDYVAAVCDRNADGDLDATSFDRHLSNASAKIEGFLIGRVGVPDPVPALFVQYCIDIAIYTAASRPPTLTDVMRERHKEAIEYFQAVAANKIKFSTAINKPHSPQIMTRQTVQSVAGSNRTFSRKSTRGIFG